MISLPFENSNLHEVLNSDITKFYYLYWVNCFSIFSNCSFFAVQQSRLQRTTLTKPQLIVSKTEMPFKNKDGGIFSMLPKDEEVKYSFKIPIKNVGLGTALNLKYSWDFDYKKAIENCGFLYRNTYDKNLNSTPSAKVIINDTCVEDRNFKGTTYFSFFKEGMHKLHAHRASYTEIEYIIPITQDKTEVFLNLPNLMPLLIANDAQTYTVITDAMLNEISIGTFKLKYEDISGCKFNVTFSCSLTLVKYSINNKNEIESAYELNLHRVKNFYGKKFLDSIYSKFNFS